MNKKILFSPVGGTDPMSETNARDGALLNIARYRKPDIIYLFMSKEIIEKHYADNRYLKCLSWLENVINHKFEVNIIEKPELEDVHIFGSIYQDLHDELLKIIATMDETDELILNMSSGTPAMKSALLVLATMLDIKCTCEQVNTPTRKMNEHIHETHPDLETLWELNDDNRLYREGNIKEGERCHPETLEFVKKLEIEDSIVKFVNAYRYKDALQLAEKLPSYNKKYLDKLKFAVARKELNYRITNQLLDKVELEIYSPVRRDGAKEIYEYALALKNRVTCGELEDFLRATSPLFFVLFSRILKKQAAFDLEDYIQVSKGTKFWDLEKLKNNEEAYESLNNYYKGNFISSWTKSSHLCVLAVDLIGDAKVVDCMKKLREIEFKVRNVAAHTMQSINKEMVKNRTGYTCEEIVELIETAFSYTDLNISKRQWNSYEEMNNDIIYTVKSYVTKENNHIAHKAETRAIIPEPIKIAQEVASNSKNAYKIIRLRRYRYGNRRSWINIIKRI